MKRNSKCLQFGQRESVRLAEEPGKKTIYSNRPKNRQSIGSSSGMEVNSGEKKDSIIFGIPVETSSSAIRNKEPIILNGSSSTFSKKTTLRRQTHA